MCILREEKAINRVVLMSGDSIIGKTVQYNLKKLAWHGWKEILQDSGFP